MGRTHKTADINAQMDEKARAEEGTRRLERRRLDSAQTRSEKEKAVGRAQAQQFRPHATLAADDKKEETVEEALVQMKKLRVTLSKRSVGQEETPSCRAVKVRGE